MSFKDRLAELRKTKGKTAEIIQETKGKTAEIIQETKADIEEEPNVPVRKGFMFSMENQKNTNNFPISKSAPKSSKLNLPETKYPYIVIGDDSFKLHGISSSTIVLEIPENVSGLGQKKKAEIGNRTIEGYHFYLNRPEMIKQLDKIFESENWKVGKSSTIDENTGEYVVMGKGLLDPIVVREERNPELICEGIHEGYPYTLDEYSEKALFFACDCSFDKEVNDKTLSIGRNILTSNGSKKDGYWIWKNNKGKGVDFITKLTGVPVTERYVKSLSSKSKIDKVKIIATVDIDDGDGEIIKLTLYDYSDASYFIHTSGQDFEEKPDFLTKTENAMISNSKKSGYFCAKSRIDVIEFIKECFPNADLSKKEDDFVPRKSEAKVGQVKKAESIGEIMNSLFVSISKHETESLVEEEIFGKIVLVGTEDEVNSRYEQLQSNYVPILSGNCGEKSYALLKINDDY